MPITVPMKIASLFAIVVELDDEFGASNFMMRTSTFLFPGAISVLIPGYCILFVLVLFFSRKVVIACFVPL